MKTAPCLLCVLLTLPLLAEQRAVPQPSYSKLWGRDGERWAESGRLPDFSYAGHRNGEREIPDHPVTANVVSLGAKGDDDTDDTAAFQAAPAALHP